MKYFVEVLLMTISFAVVTILIGIFLKISRSIQYLFQKFYTQL
ncbi:hypothetical protein IGJ10_001527 [Enterococcus sp. AZ094]